MTSDIVKTMYDKALSLVPNGTLRDIYAHVAIEGYGTGTFKIKEVTDSFIVLYDASYYYLLCPLECVRAIFMGEFDGKLSPYSQYPGAAK